MDLLWNREGAVHDLVFVNGECPTTGNIKDVVAQRLYILLRTFKGEWYLNEEYGIPWLERVLGQRVRKSTVDMMIQSAVIKEAGVRSVTYFRSWYDNSTREYMCEFRVMTDQGETDTISNVRV